MTCSVNGCDRPHDARGYCSTHYARWRRSGDPVGQTVLRSEIADTCAFDGCSRAPRSRGYCGTHYERLRRNGTTASKGKREEGSGTFTRHGYIVLQLWENGRRTLVRQHRLVMEQKIGRPLLPTEIVHHINGDRADNRPENLELWVTRSPKGQRVSDRIADAVELLARYAPEMLAKGLLIEPNGELLTTPTPQDARFSP